MWHRKKKEKDEEIDELHKEYGAISNSMFVLKRVWMYKRSTMVLLLIGAVSSASMSFIWSFIGKFVIDVVQEQLEIGAHDITPLIGLLIVTTIIEIVAMGINTVAENQLWWRTIYIRMMMIKERLAKSMAMNYETLENPKMLDRLHKAERACFGGDMGIQGMLEKIRAMMVSIIALITAMAIIFTLNPLLIFFIAVLSFVQFIFFDYTRKKDKREMWDKMAPHWRKIHYMKDTTEDFSYAKDIRLFSMKNFLTRRFYEVNNIEHEHYVKSRNYWIYNSLFAHGISLIRDALLYAYLIWCVLNDGLTIGNFTLYSASILTFSGTLTGVLNNLAGFRQCSTQVDDFRSYLDIPSEDISNTVPIPKFDSYEFTFENVSFKYNGQENYALKNLNLTLEAGKRLAIVGLNGAGKTTFIKLLLRLYDVTEGRILLNGTDIREYDRGEYYRLFSPVFQNVEIFAFPMAENVSMDEPQNTNCDLAEKCLVLAGMEDKLNDLPEGVHTELLKVIKDDGIDLSGGQKQKLALARALYKDAPVVVLDEPTAALDALAEYKLYQNFDKLIGNKTSVYISHRLSSTRFCDNIAMFKGGEMVEYGTHESLMSKNGAYAEMFDVQAQYYRDNKPVEEVSAGV